MTAHRSDESWESGCIWPGAQVWPRLVTLTGAGRRVTPAACQQSEVSRAVVRTWVRALPPVTSHHHSDNRDQSAETRDTNTQPQKWVTQWSSVYRLIIPTVVKSKAGLKISDQEEIFIVNLTNFSSIDQIGSPVITFFRPRYCDIPEKPGEYSQIILCPILSEGSWF